MAQKRMFSLAVTDTDEFLDMPTSSQALYFHLGMHGDDDGFVGSPRKIMRAAGCNTDDLKLLATKGFIIPFESGIVVIRDWKVNNTLKNDRYHETLYQAEKALLVTNKSGVYELGTANAQRCFQSGSKVEPERNRTEVSLTKWSKESGADKPPRSTRFIPPTIEEVAAYCRERGNAVDPQQFFDFYESKGWFVGRNKMRDWKAAIRNWASREKYSGNATEKSYVYQMGDDSL